MIDLNPLREGLYHLGVLVAYAYMLFFLFGIFCGGVGLTLGYILGGVHSVTFYQEFSYGRLVRRLQYYQKRLLAKAHYCYYSIYAIVWGE